MQRDQTVIDPFQHDKQNKLPLQNPPSVEPISPSDLIHDAGFPYSLAAILLQVEARHVEFFCLRLRLHRKMQHHHALCHCSGLRASSRSAVDGSNRHCLCWIRPGTSMHDCPGRLYARAKRRAVPYLGTPARMLNRGVPGQNLFILKLALEAGDKNIGIFLVAGCFVVP